MSVPTHNLYDFIHQTTENQYIVKYFYPWGSRDINCLIDQITGSDVERKKQLVPMVDNIFRHASQHFSWTSFQPVLLCHDQEPLNFNLYANNSANLRQVKTGGGEPTISYYKKWILLHSEKNSLEVEKYKQSNLFEPVHWWCHSIIARDWYRYAEHDLNFTKKSSKKRFLIYARASDGTRIYRKNFLQMIPSDNSQIGSFDSHLPITSDSSATYNAVDYANTDMSIILETITDRIHLTEKTCRAIACKHPFLLVAGQGSLQYLKKYGFKTFAPIINEEYDREPDLEKRMKMVANEMHRVKTMNTDQMKKLTEIAEYNHKRFFSKDFFGQVVNELKTNVNKARSAATTIDYRYLYRDQMQRPKTDPRYIKRRPYILSLIQHLRKGGTLDDYVPPDLD